MEARLSQDRERGTIDIESKKLRSQNDASDGDNQSRQEFGSRNPVNQADKGNVCRHGKVQRGTGKGGRSGRNGRASAELKGQASKIFGAGAQCDGWSIHRDEGTRRGLLAVASEVNGRGGGMA